MTSTDVLSVVQWVHAFSDGHSQHNLTGSAGSTNFGDCVDIWAPGNDIAGPWGVVGGNSDENVTFAGTPVAAGVTPPPGSHSGWGRGSGTSFSAPHVAAAAAYVADSYELTSPANIEYYVRLLSQPVTPAPPLAPVTV